MKADLASPVHELPATLTLADGKRLAGGLFVAPGQSVTSALEQRRSFVPITVAGRFRLVARAQIACISLSAFRADKDPGLPLTRHPIMVELASAVRLGGALAFLPAPGRGRIADHLNEDCDSFLLHDGETVHLVMKAHVAWIEEAR